MAEIDDMLKNLMPSSREIYESISMEDRHQIMHKVVTAVMSEVHLLDDIHDYHNKKHKAHIVVNGRFYVVSLLTKIVWFERQQMEGIDILLGDFFEFPDEQSFQTDFNITKQNLK